jgi:pilus assembly protein CpaB
LKDELKVFGEIGLSTKLLIMGGLAATFGGVSYVAGNSYLENQTQARLSEIENQRQPIQEINLAKLVVAKNKLGFGQTITPDDLKLVDWPKESFPEGGFSSIDDIVEDETRRAIAAVHPGEPVIASKLTGENGRAGLAGLIADGKRAVTIPVDTVKGVGGFVQPGDYVDIILTRNLQDEDREETVAKIMMENVKVLSVDQEAGDRSSTARVAKSVTLETDSKGAQRIALSLNVGRLSLLLRSAGDTESVNSGSVSSDNLDGESDDGGMLSFLKSEPTTKSIKVTSGTMVQNFTVKIEKPKKVNDIKKKSQ